jgi:hypothetical protein
MTQTFSHTPGLKHSASRFSEVHLQPEESGALHWHISSVEKIIMFFWFSYGLTIQLAFLADLFEIM